MPTNRNALIRYKTIDRCLQNRYRKWTLEDLIEACSEALYEYEGIDSGVSRRTVQADIQMMRSDKLGYNAPIVVQQRKYYTYEDSEYSITQIPLTDQDLGQLSEAVEFLKQFQGFSHFQQLDGMVQKLEDHIYSQKTQSRPVIDFEKNDNLKGLQYLDPLYRAIIRHQALSITYQSFNARQASSFLFYPYLLKEFRNRWFLIGRRKNQKGILNLALDRIQAIEQSQAPFHSDPDFDPDTHFRDAIGVSVNPGQPPEEVRFFASWKHAPYLLTKPLHASQQELSQDSYGVVFSLQVQHNFELEKEMLGFGQGIMVLHPPRLRRRIRERMQSAIDNYQSDLQERGLVSALRKLKHQGHSILHYVFTSREIRAMQRVLEPFLQQAGRPHAQRELLRVLPALRNMIFNKNLLRIIHEIDPDAFLTKAIFFDKTPEANWFVRWHQDLPINVQAKKEVPGYEKWTEKEGLVSVCPPETVGQNRFSVRIHLDDTDAQNGALKVLAGSHQRVLNDAEIQLLAENSLSASCEVPAGGIHLLKPLILHASAKTKSPKRRRVIHLEFASVELADGLQWLERAELPKPAQGALPS